ncbi:hypothetical protein ACHAPJ_002737 [Fusarium lateritium]
MNQEEGRRPRGRPPKRPQQQGPGRPRKIPRNEETAGDAGSEGSEYRLDERAEAAVGQGNGARSGGVPGQKRGRGRPPGSKNKSGIAGRPNNNQRQTRVTTRARSLAGNEDEEHMLGQENEEADDEAMEGDELASRPRDNSRADGFEISEWAPRNVTEREAFRALNEAYHRGVNAARERYKKLPPMTKEKFEARGMPGCTDPPRFGDCWTPEGEEELKASWENSLIKFALERLSKVETSISSVWKMSLHRFRLDPMTLLSAYQKFRFDNAGNESFLHNGVMKVNPLWTIPFCQKLKRIFAHPLWNGPNAWRFIPIAIRWAVICRVDDRSGFSNKEQEILDHLHCGDLRVSDGNESMAKRFRAHQKQVTDSGLIQTLHAKLLSRIADYAGTSNRPTMDGNRPVRTGDLSVVVKALDNLNDRGMAISCETHLRVYIAGWKTHGYPSGQAEFVEAYKNRWINVERQKRMSIIQDQGRPAGARASADNQVSVQGESQVGEEVYDFWEDNPSDDDDAYHGQDLGDDLGGFHPNDEAEERMDGRNEGLNFSPGNDENNGEIVLPHLGDLDDALAGRDNEFLVERTRDENSQQTEIAGAGGSGGEARRPRHRMKRSYRPPSSSDVGDDD